MGNQRKANRKKAAAVKAAALKIKKVVLAPSVAAHVVIPKGFVPIVSVDPKKPIVEIVPIPVKKTESWWHYWFGPADR